MIRVGIADDSPFTCRLLRSFVESTGQCRVVGMAHTPGDTLALARREQLDVLTMDLEMPGVSGLDLLRRLLSDKAPRVVVVSGVSKGAAAATLRALELGAVDFVLKYTPGLPSNPEALRREVLTKVIAAATATPSATMGKVSGPIEPDWTRMVDEREEPLSAGGPGVVVIGASTGGRLAVRELLTELPAAFPHAVVVIQHLPAAFIAAFAGLLADESGLRVEEASATHDLEPGRVLVAPGGRHLAMKATGRIDLLVPEASDLYRPSIDVAMRSAADAFGRGAIGVVLTGMGNDGADGLRHIRARGGKAYVQRPDSCVIGGMPMRALETAGADFVGTPRDIGRALARRERRAA